MGVRWWMNHVVFAVDSEEENGTPHATPARIFSFGRQSKRTNNQEATGMSRKKAMKISRRNICLSTFLIRKEFFPASHAASL